MGLLRQHIRSTDRIHGIVTNGGVAPNVVPAHTSAKYIIRSETLDQLDGIAPESVTVASKPAPSPRAREVAITGGDKPYAEMRHDEAIAVLLPPEFGGARAALSRISASGKRVRPVQPIWATSRWRCRRSTP